MNKSRPYYIVETASKAGRPTFANVSLMIVLPLLLGTLMAVLANNPGTTGDQKGTHYYSVTRERSRTNAPTNGEPGQTVSRGTTARDGTAFGNLILAPNTRYRARVLQPGSLRVGQVDFETGPNGSTTRIPPIILGTDISKDTDGDGLSDEGESIMGTDPAKADTDGDGILDGAEVQQGTDPLRACLKKRNSSKKLENSVDIRSFRKVSK